MRYLWIGLILLAGVAYGAPTPTNTPSYNYVYRPDRALANTKMTSMGVFDGGVSTASLKSGPSTFNAGVTGTTAGYSDQVTVPTPSADTSAVNRAYANSAIHGKEDFRTPVPITSTPEWVSAASVVVTTSGTAEAIRGDWTQILHTRSDAYKLQILANSTPIAGPITLSRYAIGAVSFDEICKNVPFYSVVTPGPVTIDCQISTNGGSDPITSLCGQIIYEEKR